MVECVNDSNAVHHLREGTIVFAHARNSLAAAERVYLYDLSFRSSSHQ